MSEALYPGRRVLFGDPGGVPRNFARPPGGTCCVAMTAALENDCGEHADPFACPDVFVSYAPAFNEYGLIVRDGGTSVVLISFCPWCGAKLPESLRDRWFDALEAEGFDAPLFEDNLPEPYMSAAWWRDAKTET